MKPKLKKIQNTNPGMKKRMGYSIFSDSIDREVRRPKTLPVRFPLASEYLFSPSTGRMKEVQTGNMIYKTNQAHGLQWIGKEEIADAVEGNQCHGTTNSIDS
jgi:hypothetical protein